MMEKAQLIATPKIAIVGLDAYFREFQSLAAFERSIYEGQSCSSAHVPPQLSTLSATEIQQKFDQVANTALQGVSLSQDAEVAVILAQPNPQPVAQNPLTHFTGVDSVFLALEMAQKLLRDRDVEVVLVGAIDPHPQHQAVGALVLKREDTAKSDSIYATLNFAAPTVPFPPDLAQLEILGDQPLEAINIQRLMPTSGEGTQAYRCAISSAINHGYQGIAAEIASILKTVLCLYYRYIPPVPHWTRPQHPNVWQNSPFYVATEAKPWFLEAGLSQRVAAIHDLRTYSTSLIFTEATAPPPRMAVDRARKPGYLFPLAGYDCPTLLTQLHTLQQSLENSDLATLARQAFLNYQQQLKSPYTLTLIARNQPELDREIDRALTGIPQALATGKDWQTPVGSYFTPNPQGQSGKVAYVYPSAYNAHLGLAQDLFRLFPNLFADPVIQTTCHRVANLEKLLYPRSWQKLSRRQLEALEKRLLDDPLAMLESEIGFASLITTLLRDYFHLQPQAAFGYSLGEISMMYAQGVWSDLNEKSNALNTSPLFKTRLAGSKDAVREYWQLPAEAHSEELWCTYVVMADAQRIRARLRGENRVYLTQVSTPQEVVIAGEPQACERVVASLGCDAFRAPFKHVIHCEAIRSESDELIRLNTLPLQTIPQVTFYSAADYQPITLNTSVIARSLARTLCQQLDFPRLVNRVYQDNYRIFVEVGAGSNCSRWIDTILQSKDHVTVALHRRGTDDFTALLKAFAKLVSHRVELELAPLYGQETNPFSSQEFTIKTFDAGRQKKQQPATPCLQPELNLRFAPKLTQSHSSVSKAHATLIANEHASLTQTQTVIQVQIEYLQQVMQSKIPSKAP